MRTLTQDLRLAARLLAKSPGFTLAATLTLALGLGANTAMFSVVYAVMLRPLPYAQPDRLVRVRGGSSYPDLADWTSQAQSFEGFGAYRPHFYDQAGAEGAERIEASLVTGDLMRILRAKAALGRPLQAEDDRPGGEKVVVVSHSFWRRRMSGEADAVGRSVTFAGGTYRVIGVMPPSFRLLEADKAELWAPVRVESAQEAEARGAHTLWAVGRLRDGVSLEAAQAEMDAVARRLAEAHPDENKDRRFVLMPLHDFLVRGARPALQVLLGAVAFLLLIATTNVANLLLARAASREREIAIRASLGASRWRLLRQLLCESLLLVALGGAAGILVAAWISELVVRLGPADVPGLDSVSLDLRVLAFTAGVSLLAALLFSLAPWLHACQVSLLGSLKEGGRTGEGQVRHRVRNALVVSELALALVLLVGAGLLLRSLHRLQSIDPGFDPSRLFTFDLTLPMESYHDIPKRTRLYESVLTDLATLPGVEKVAAGSELPFGTGMIYHNFVVEGRPPLPVGTEPEIYSRSVSPEYFATLGIALVRGRGFSRADDAGAPPVVVINEAAARAHFAGEDPIGRRIAWARATPLVWMTIVGVVGDVRASGTGREEVPAVYAPIAQESRPWKTWMTVAIRSSLPPSVLLPAVKRAVARVAPAVPVTRPRTMDELMAASAVARRFNLLLLGAFAALALALAAVGVHGVISYAVGHRIHEVGVRVALGATPRDILRLVVGQGFVLAAGGAVLGSVAALGLSRFVSGMLFGVRATDPVTFAGVAALLVAVALLACYLPARRALRVDPVVALRYE
ncbi:MAG TPA: ABC transporter permease [Vicinamibacteria bacterium]|nr:ABC transporter permease [Vicinamibacteria bacterium]